MEAGKMQPRIAVQYQPAWLTWLAATSTCLTALDVTHDLTDLAGYSGYAFCLSIHEDLCPSGPTVMDWHMLDAGVHSLGRTTARYIGHIAYPVDKSDPQYRINCRAMFNFVRAETSSGRPAVIWGAYAPEFAVVTGTGDDCYHVSSFREILQQDQPPIDIHDLDLISIHYALAFPSPGNAHRGHADRDSVFRARRLLTQHSDHAGYGWGLWGYQLWSGALKAGRGHPLGSAYNAQCWFEARHHAAAFLARIAERTPAVATPLSKAADHLAATAAALREVAKLFPFPPPEDLPGADSRQAASEQLMDAKSHEEKAIVYLHETCDTPWPVVNEPMPS